MIIKNFFTSIYSSILLTAFFTALFTYFADKKFDKFKFNNNKIKIEQIVNAEIFENIEIIDKYYKSKEQIINDTQLCSFLRDQRFYVDSLKDLMATNFQYLEKEDLYSLAIIRDRMNILNKKFEIIWNDIQKISDKLEKSDNFIYFNPKKKISAHLFLSDDFNHLIYYIKQLSFFEGNLYPDLDKEFKITKTQVMVGYFDYNKEWDKVK